MRRVIGCRVSSAVASATLLMLAAGSTAADNGGRASIALQSVHLVEQGACSNAPIASAPLTLENAIELTLCRSPEYRSAWYAVRERAANIGVSRAALLPTIVSTLSYDYYHRTQKTESIFTFFDIDKKYWVPGVDAGFDYPLFDFGARTARLRQARQLLNAASADAQYTLLEVVVKAADAYYNAVNSRAALESARSSATGAAEIHSVVIERARGGASAAVDEVRARAASDEAQTKLISAGNDYAAALGHLAITIGLAAETRLTLPRDENIQTGAPSMVGCSFDEPIEDLFRQAVRTSPRLAVARAERDAAEHGVRAARAESRPVLSLRARYQVFDQNITGTGNQFGISEPPDDSRMSSLNAGLKLEVPLFDGRARVNRLRAARAVLGEKEATLKGMEEQVVSDVWDNYHAFRTACCDGAQPLQKFLRTTRELSDATRGRYMAGVGDVFEAVEAQRSLVEAEALVLRNRASCTLSTLRLSADLGRLGF